MARKLSENVFFVGTLYQDVIVKNVKMWCYLKKRWCYLQIVQVSMHARTHTHTHTEPGLTVFDDSHGGWVFFFVSHAMVYILLDMVY